MGRIIAAFDFDGTLTVKDLLLPFLQFIEGSHASLYGKLALGIPWYAGFAAGLVTRQEAKERTLQIFLKGLPKAALEEKGSAFARGPLKKYLRSDALEKLNWHQVQGHTCLLVSATLDLFLRPWVEEMGFQDLICSELAWDKEMRATGELRGTNCWGAEKQRRLLEWAGPRDEFVLYAYGDSRGDREMLAMADYPFFRKFQ